MGNVLGPQAGNQVTTRPARAAAYGVSRTWHKSCSSPTAQDGTVTDADMFNDWLAQLRQAYDNSGISIDNGDDMLWRTILSRSLRFADDTGSANAVAAAFTPPVAELYPGLSVIVNVAHPNTTAATFTADATTAASIVRRDGSPLFPGDLPSDFVLLSQDDAGKWRIMAPSSTGTPALTANTNYYVNASTGSDSNNGLTTVTAFQTIQHAVNVAAGLNLNGYVVTINVAAGTYGGYVLPKLGSVGIVIIQGDLVTPANVLLSVSSGACIKNGAQGVDGYIIYGMKCLSSANNAGEPGCGIWMTTGSAVKISKMDFGACYYAHIVVDGGLVQITGTDGPGGNGFINISGSGGYAHLASFDGGKIYCDSVVLNVNTAASFSTGFAMAYDGAIIKPLYGTINNPSNATGPRYFSDSNSVIDTNGGGASFLPGSTAGSTANGGYYG